MTTDIVEYQAPSSVTVFGTDDPAAIVEMVESKAKALGDFIRAHGMSKRLESDRARQRREREGREAPREYVMIEGWSFLGQMLGIAPVTREVREVRDPESNALLGFEARVELVRPDGSVVGGAVGECSWAEERWANREPYAVKSMAQTRAVGKAYRLAYGFVMAAAGFDATPMEEMPHDFIEGEVVPPQPRRQPQAPPPWADDLKEALADLNLTLDAVGAYLNCRPTTEAIQGWLDANGGTVFDLVALAAPSEEPAEVAEVGAN